MAGNRNDARPGRNAFVHFVHPVRFVHFVRFVQLARFLTRAVVPAEFSNYSLSLLLAAYVDVVAASAILACIADSLSESYPGASWGGSANRIAERPSIRPTHRIGAALLKGDTLRGHSSGPGHQRGGMITQHKLMHCSIVIRTGVRIVDATS